MDGIEYRFRRGAIVVGDTGIEVTAARTAVVFVPWHAVGHIEIGQNEARERLIRMHLADGRTVPLPAPCAEDEPSAEIFRAWRRYSKERIAQPHDEIPREFRAAAARRLDPVQDDVPASGRSILSRWVRRRRRRIRQTGERA